MSAICASIRSQALAKAHPPAVAPAPENAVAPWCPRPVGVPPTPPQKCFDIYIVPAAHFDAADAQYGSKAMAWAFLNSNEAVIKEDYWPRFARPGLPESTGYLDTARVPSMFSNSLQEGIYLHEVLGHAIRGSVHEGNADPNYKGTNKPNPDPTMNSAEFLPREERIHLMLEVSKHYAALRILPWSPGLDVFLDDTLVAA